MCIRDRYIEVALCGHGFEDFCYSLDYDLSTSFVIFSYNSGFWFYSFNFASLRNGKLNYHFLKIRLFFFLKKSWKICKQGKMKRIKKGPKPLFKTIIFWFISIFSGYYTSFQFFRLVQFRLTKTTKNTVSFSVLIQLPF